MSILTLSHGNADPERGFSINKLLLQAHGTQILPNTLELIRLIKSWLIRYGGGSNIAIDKPLLKLVSNSLPSYTEYERVAKLARNKKPNNKLQLGLKRKKESEEELNVLKKKKN